MTMCMCAAAASSHRAVREPGDYSAFAAGVLAPLSGILFSTIAIQPGDRVLNVAAGNAEAMPFRAGEFDAVLSTLSAMFAPRQQRTANEVARVCRRGGTIGVLSWTPDGFYGRFLSAIRPYRPLLPPGAPPEVWWGREEYVSDLFRDHVVDARTRIGALRVDRFDAPEQCRDYFKRHYDPAINAYRAIADSPGRVAALDAELAELCGEYLKDGVMDWEYLTFTASKG